MLVSGQTRERNRAMSIHAGKVRQEKLILLLALYTLRKKFGFSVVTKDHALRFIAKKNLMTIPLDELDKRTGADAIWENDLAWRRKDLVESGLMTFRPKNEWEISARGMGVVEACATKVEEAIARGLTWNEVFASEPEEEIYWNAKTIEALLAISRRCDVHERVA